MGDAEMSRDILNLRKSETSDFFDTNIRTLGAKPPYFCPKKSDVFNFRFFTFGNRFDILHKKSFAKKNHISYTTWGNVQDIKAFSGV